jgi:HEAT repeat protein
MALTQENTEESGLIEALQHARSSVRLRAAMAAGTRPDPRYLEKLLERCAVEPDFFVRDMLTWALTRQPAALTVPRLVDELSSGRAQARSQALHTLSKIGDGGAWPAISRSLLSDPDSEVARSAWRAAVVLVPDGERGELAATLATQLGRGDRDTQLSLSRALIALGDVVEPVLATATANGRPRVRTHAIATERLRRNPDTGFEAAIEEAKRIVALGPDGAPGAEEGAA